MLRTSYIVWLQNVMLNMVPDEEGKWKYSMDLNVKKSYDKIIYL